MTKSQKLFSFVRKNSLAILLVVVLLFAFYLAFAFSVKREGFAKPKKAQHLAQDKAKKAYTNALTSAEKDQKQKDKDDAWRKKNDTIQKCIKFWKNDNKDQNITQCVNDAGYPEYQFPRVY